MNRNHPDRADTTQLQVSPLTRAIRRGLVYGSVIAVSSTLAAAPASAQDSGEAEDYRSDYALEEVTVTATRRETTIFEVPYAISAISGKDIRRAGVQDLSDLVRVVPGIAYLEQGPRVANNNNYIILRGLNATSQSGAADTPFLAQPAVSTYFGSIPIFANFQTADLNRVEVLRGPQGTLYGSGSLGGTLRFIPNTPSTDETTFETWTELSATAHSSEMNYDLSAVWNQPISDRSALRFAAGIRHLGGFIDYDGRVEPDENGYPIPEGDYSWKTKPRQKDQNDSTDWYFRGMGSFEVTDNSNILLTWQHQDLEVDNRQSHSFEFESANIDEEYVQLIPYEEPMESEMDLLGMDIEVNLGFATLSSSTSYTTSEAEWARDATGLYQTAFYWYTNYYYPYTTAISLGDSGQDIIAQEFRLVSNNTDSKWDWVAGLYYMDQDFFVNEVQSIPGLRDYIINDPFTYAVVPPPGDVVYPAEREWNFTDLAAFGELTYHINDSWQVTGGVRVFDQEFDQLFVFHAPFCPSLYYAPATCGDPGGDGITTTTRLAEDISDQIFKFNTSVEVTDHSKVYFTWSEGFRHGGANAVPTQGPWPEAPGIYEGYDPDEATNWEIGYKGSTPGGKMSYTLAAFYIEWEKTQFDTFTEINAFSAIVNGTDAVAQGFEVELAGMVTENWTYMFGYNYTQSEWDQDGFVGSSALFKGDQLPGVPKHMASLSTDYYWPVDMGDIYFHADAFYRGSAETAPNPLWGNYEDLDSFSIWNFAVGLEKPSWGLRVFLDNAFDEVGITGGQLEEGYLNYAYHFVQRPRTVGAQLRYKFR
jgi:iron complex outermembrane receptor protein